MLLQRDDAINEMSSSSRVCFFFARLFFLCFALGFASFVHLLFCLVFTKYVIFTTRKAENLENFSKLIYDFFHAILFYSLRFPLYRHCMSPTINVCLFIPI